MHGTRAGVGIWWHSGCSPTQRLAYWQLAALHSGNSLWELSSNVERYLTQGSSLSPKVAQIQEECNCWPLVSIQNKSERPPQLQSSSWVRGGLYCNHWSSASPALFSSLWVWHMHVDLKNAAQWTSCMQASISRELPNEARKWAKARQPRAHSPVWEMASVRCSHKYTSDQGLKGNLQGTMKESLFVDTWPKIRIASWGLKFK